MSRFWALLWLLPSMGVAQGLPVNRGPGGGSDLFFIIPHPQNADILFVGGDIEGIFRSMDGGATWENVSTGLSMAERGRHAYFIQDILVDTFSERVYLATGVGLFESSDTGKTWNILWSRPLDPSSEEYASVGVVALRPSTPPEIWIGLGDRRSYSGSTDFTPWPPYDLPTGVFRSSDGGTTWDSIPVPLDSAGVQGIVFKGPDSVFVCSTDGVFRSVDGGATWTAADAGLPHTQCNWMVGVNRSGTWTLVLSLHTLGTSGNPASFQGGIFRSTDGGNSWEDITGNLPRYMPSADLFYEYWQVTPHPLFPDTLYVGTTRGSGWDSSGLWITQSVSASTPTWNWVYAPATTGWMDSSWFPDPYVRGIAVPPGAPTRIYITHVYVESSPDGGNTWESRYTVPVGAGWKTTGLECGNADAIAFHPQDSTVLWIGYDDFGLFRSEDGGESFLRLDPQMNPVWPYSTGDGVRQILVDPAAPQNVYVTRWSGSLAAGCAIFCYDDGGILFSQDGGDTFTDLMQSPMPNQAPWLAVDFTSGSPGNRQLFVAIFGDGVYRSTDNGTSWTKLLHQPRAWILALHPLHPDTIFLGLNLAVQGGSILLYRSTDGGTTWTPVSLPLSPTGSDAITDLRVLPSGEVYAVYEDVYRWPYTTLLLHSGDGGSSWTVLYSHTLPLVMDIHPSFSDVLAVAVGTCFRGHPGETSGDILLSYDGGANWTSLGIILPHHGFNFLRFHPMKRSLYVGTGGNGVWEIPDLPIPVQESATTPRSIRLRWTAQGYVLSSCRKGTSLTLLDLSGRVLRTFVCRSRTTPLPPVRSGTFFLRSSGGSVFKVVLVR